MDSQSTNYTESNYIETIATANKEMLNYFNKTFLDNLESIQTLKTQAFEIDIKIDELKKTKDLYAFKSTSRKSVFTPIISDDFENERSKIIDTQIADLESARESVSTKIISMEASLVSLKKRLAILNNADNAIKQLYDITFSRETSVIKNEDGFEFIEEDSPDDIGSHGYNILMQDAFDKALLSTLVDRNLKDGITSVNHKLEVLSYLLSTDVSRAKLTVQEIKSNLRGILDSIDDINNRLDYNLESTKPISTQISEYIDKQRDFHPEITIETTIASTDDSLTLHPVFGINLFKLLDIFFNNIYTHSNANKVEFELTLNPNEIEVTIQDNGVGIDDNYLDKSPWYSGLHKSNEIIFLLNGKLEIKGDVITGTKINFSFPIQAK